MFWVNIECGVRCSSETGRKQKRSEGAEGGRERSPVRLGLSGSQNLVSGCWGFSDRKSGFGVLGKSV